MTATAKNEFLAGLLRSSARALAGYAASELVQSVPASKDDFEVDPFTMWQNWLAGRTEELAAAIAVGKPELFADEIQWGTSVLESRGIPPEHFKASIECLRRVLLEELPEDGRQLADDYIRRGLDRFDGATKEPCRRLTPETPAGRLGARYLAAVLEGDRRQARTIVLEEAARELSIPKIYLEVVLPTQEEIGRMWLANEITVAEEHFATSTTRTLLAQLLARAPARPRNGKTAMTAAVAGNRHDIGLHIVCDFLEMDGWKAVQLGADVPVADLVEAVGCFQVDLLALAATQSQHLQTLRETIAAVRSQQDAEIKILVGGLALRSCSDAAYELGADAYAASAPEAVSVADSLFGLPYDPDFFK